MSNYWTAVGASRDYMDIESERRHGELDALIKADEPLFSASQCALCKRGVQEDEPLVRDQGRVAHIRCVRALVDLINAGRAREYVPEPDMEAVQASVQKSEKRYERTAEAMRKASIPQLDHRLPTDEDTHYVRQGQYQVSHEDWYNKRGWVWDAGKGRWTSA